MTAPTPDPGIDPDADLAPDHEHDQEEAIARDAAPAPPSDEFGSQVSHAKPAPPSDRWSHRRGEPRVLALLWALYLFATVAGGLLWVTRLGSLSPSAYGPAARVMLVMIAIGVTVLWPMTRLSQAPPSPYLPSRRPGSPFAEGAAGARDLIRRPIMNACVTDLMIVLGPILVIVWPMAALAGWAYGVIAALAAMFVVWGAVAGAMICVPLVIESRWLAHRTGKTAGTWRSIWTLACIAVSTAAIVLPWVAGQPTSPDGTTPAGPAQGWLQAASPYSFIFVAAGQGLAGPSSPIDAVAWYSIAATGLIASLVWGLAGWFEASGRKRIARLD